MTAREARNRRRAAERREMKLARKNVIASGATVARPDEAAPYQRAEDFNVEAAPYQRAEDFNVEAAPYQRAEDFNVEAAPYQRAEDSRNGSLERREAKLARKNVAAIATEIAPEAPQATTRAEINRANSGLSTGPRTPEGKARSSRNSFKHGLYSQQLIIEGEDPAEFDQLRATLRTEHQPVNSTEEILVDELSQHFWRMRRFRVLEARAWSPENLDAWCESGLLALIQRSMSSAERAFHKALATLQKLQKDRPANHAGFVPAKSYEAAFSQRAEDVNVQFVPSELHPVRTSRFDFSPTWRSLVARQLVSATSDDFQSSDR